MKELTGEKCARSDCDWRVIGVRDVHGVRHTAYECQACKRVQRTVGHAPTLGDRHRRQD